MVRITLTEPLSSWTMILLGLWAATAAPGAEEAVTLRYRWTPHAVWAVDVQSDYTQTVLVPGEPMTPEQVSARGTELWHVREVEGDVATLDRFTAEVEGALEEDPGRGLDFGSGPPMGYCETLRRDARGQVVAHIPAGPDDPFGAFRAVLVQAADTLPERPVRPGDTWPARSEAPWGVKETPVRWSGEVKFERLDVPNVLLVATLRSRVQHVTLAPRTVARREGEKVVTAEVRDQIGALSGQATRTLHFDPAAGWPTQIEERVSLQMEVTQTVREGGTTLVNGRTVAVTRQGTTVWTFRPPTDEELVRAIALAIVNGLERHDLDLLFSFHDPAFTGPDGDLASLRQQAEDLFTRFPRLEVLCGDLQASLGEGAGLLTFHRQVYAADKPDGPLKPAAEDDVTLRLRRVAARWVVVGAE